MPDASPSISTAAAPAPPPSPPAPPPFDLDVVAAPVLAFAMEQSGTPLVRDVVVRNRGAEPLRGASLDLELAPGLGEITRVAVPDVAPGEEARLGVVDYRLPPGRLREVVEAERARLVATLRRGDGEPLVRVEREVDVLAHNEWPGARGPLALLAMFALPNHPVVGRVLARARDRLAAAGGNPALAGYQERSPARVRAAIAALYETVQALGVTYVGLPASFEATGQKIRLPDALLRDGLANCLDVTCLLAACLEQLGLHPLVVVVEGHAFPAAWLVDERFPEGVVEDAARLRNLIALGEVVAFDSTAAIARPAVPFERAREVADAALRDDARFAFALDVRVLRGDGYRPLPIRVAASEEAAPAARPAGAGAPVDDVRRILAEAAREAPPREEKPRPPAPPPAVATRFRQWQDRLLDLSLRNRLLHFGLRGRGALPLAVPDVGVFEDLLAGERGFEVLARPLADPKDERDPELARARADEPALRAARLADLRAGVLHVPLSESELWSRAAHLARTARTDLEEGGASTLFAAIGLLRWFESADADAEPRLAPLLLYPVDLEFDRRKRRVRLRRLAEDPVANVTLIEKMRREFEVDISAIAAVEADDSGLDVPALLRAARAAIARLPRWEVLEEAHVGLFTFTKFLMWKDLAENQEALLASPVVRHIAASRDQTLPAQPPALEADRVDAELAPADLAAVLDADATQLAAVASALRGRSFVLQGPPGTGKSQTIANLVAAALAAGKSVLFVSEKMAALEVVYRRLEEAGLGDFCLELHSHKASKKTVLESIGRALERAERQGAVPWEERSRALAELRDRLNAYVRALHAPLPVGLAFHAAEARLLELAEAPELRFKVAGIEKASEADLRARREAVAALAPRALAVEPAPAHPFAACAPAGWSAAAEEALGDAIEAASTSLEAIEVAAKAAGDALGIAVPAATEPLGALAKLAAALGEGPLASEGLVRSDFAAVAERARRWIAARRENAARRKHLLERWSEGVLDERLAEEAARFEGWAKSFAPVRFFALLGARGRMKTLAKGALGSDESVAIDLALAVKTARARRELAEEGRGIAKALGMGTEATFEKKKESEDDEYEYENGGVEALVERTERARKAAGALQAAVARAPRAEAEPPYPRSPRAESRGAESSLDGPAALGEASVPADRRARIAEAAKALEGALAELVAKEDALLAAASAKPGAAWPAREDAAHRGGLRGRLGLWRERLRDLRPWCFYRQEAERLRALGLGALADAHGAGKLAARDLESAFERWLLARLIAAARDREPALRDFEGTAHHALVERFRAADVEHRVLARRHAAARLEARLPAVGAQVSESSETGILLRELRKKTRHMAIRKLVAELPALLPRLKPCLLMSPLSVAQYLPADGRSFDLVVFDEASQIGTHDAIGAIARGKQVVVVGDSKQLPPTTFFVRALDDDAATPDDEDVVELESILDEAVAKQLPQQMLGWHYRSRHESLIDFSNRHYYGGRLDVFPAARARVDDLGVAWHPVADGVYTSGGGPGGRTNRREAEALVAHLVAALRRAAPGERSFGVVTFNIAQQELIHDLLEEARARAPAIEPHFAGPEAVFVKNLENVQGDERDEILFSVTYARDQNGRLRTQFGPLSAAGGERRLNVAITRARAKLRVFATLRAEEIDLARSAARGTAHLKAFLAHVAKEGAAEAPAEASAPAFASRFEREVHDALVAAGHAVRTRVGCGGYRVDLAVLDPARAGEYLLGVEGDGPSYAAARTARDRDRLRRQVLESLGWRMHRVWSTDWWFDRAKETGRLLEAVEGAKRARAEQERAREQAAARPAEEGKKEAFENENENENGREEASSSRDAPPAAVAPRKAEPPSRPYVTADLGAASAEPEDLYLLASAGAVRARIVAAVAAEGPIHVDLLARRVLACWGVAKLTARPRQRVAEEVAALERAKQVRRRGEFVWAFDAAPERLEHFRVAASEAGEREADELPPEECAVAAAWVLAQSFSLDASDLVRETAKVLGFARAGKQVALAVERGVELLKARGWCVVEEGRASWVSESARRTRGA